MDGEVTIEPVTAPHDEDYEQEAIKMEPEVIILNEDEENFYNGDCDQENLRTTKNKQAAGSQKLVCECGRRFPTHDWLVAHLATCSCRQTLAADGEKRLAEERTHFCSDCGKAFLRRKHLQRHEKTHTGGRPHVCEDCGAGFFRSEHLARHMKTHQGQEKYECFVCSKQLTRPEHLTRHLKTHDRDKRQVCPQCGEVFVLTKELLDHLQERHT